MSWIFFLLILYFIYKQLSKSARMAKRQSQDQRPVPYPGEDTYRDDDAYGDGYPYPTETVKTDSYDRRYWEGPYEKENDPYEVVTGGGKTKVTFELPERMASESIREKAQPEVGPNPVFQAALAEADEPTVEVEEEVGVTQVQRAAQPARMPRNRLQAGLIWSEIWQTPVACRRGMRR